MNSWAVLAGLEGWKPAVTALLLPPVPGLLAILIGAWLLPTRRAAGWPLLGAGIAAIWLSTCAATAAWLESALLDVPAPVSATRIQALKLAQDRAASRERLAVVILGGGREPFAPEYAGPSLEWPSLERLRYGVWLAKSIGSPVAFSGGVGWGQSAGDSEARIAAQIAAPEFALPLRWTEDASRDTRTNAAGSVQLLLGSDVRHILLVTHGWHMPRALRAFEQAAAGRLQIEAAPMGLAPVREGGLLDWLPSSHGATRTRQVVREWLGTLAGA